jgi:hypothetical protein
MKPDLAVLLKERWASIGSSAKISLMRVTADQTVGCWLNGMKYLSRSALVSMMETSDLGEFHNSARSGWLNCPRLRPYL